MVSELPVRDSKLPGQIMPGAFALDLAITIWHKVFLRGPRSHSSTAMSYR